MAEAGQAAVLWPGSLLDPADGLHLGAVGVGAQFPEVLVFASVAVALHDVLEAAVPGQLAAHPAGEKREGAMWGGARSEGERVLGWAEQRGVEESWAQAAAAP